MMRTFLAIVVIVTSATLAAPNASQADGRTRAPAGAPAVAATSVSTAQFRVGPPEIIANGHSILDNFFNVVKVNGIYRGYMGNHVSMRYEGTSLEDLHLRGGDVLPLGPSGKFDECGALIYAVVADPDPSESNILRAWYHAEQKDGTECDYTSSGAGQTHKSIAYAESTDGGLTFTKPDYPGNRVITRTDSWPGHEPGIENEVSGRGDFGFVRSTQLDPSGIDYYYIYYLDHKKTDDGVDEFGAVARATVASNGAPVAGDPNSNPWVNYAGAGQWNSPGLEGESSALSSPVMSSASIFEPSGEVVRVRQRPMPLIPDVNSGIIMSYSSTAFGFTSRAVTEPLVFMNDCDSYEAPRTDLPQDHPFDICDPNNLDTIDPGNPDGQRLGYTSIVGPTGATKWSNSFYLFYVYGMPGVEGWKDRYFVRRKVTVTERPIGEPQAKLALGVFESKNGDRPDVWTTAGVVPVTHQYAGTTGYIMTSPGDGRLLLSDCVRTNGEHYPSTTNCASDTDKARDIGFIWDPMSTQPGTVFLKLCESYANGAWKGDRYATTDDSCRSGFSFRWNLGRVYQAVGDETSGVVRNDKASVMFSGHQDLQRWSYLSYSGGTFSYDPLADLWSVA